MYFLMKSKVGTYMISTSHNKQSCVHIHIIRQNLAAIQTQENTQSSVRDVLFYKEVKNNKETVFTG